MTVFLIKFLAFMGILLFVFSAGYYTGKNEKQ